MYRHDDQRHYQDRRYGGNARQKMPLWGSRRQFGHVAHPSIKLSPVFISLSHTRGVATIHDRLAATSMLQMTSVNQLSC